ncbi:hypothetical protein GCM10010365_37370 [Streptomyces poonensis]|uniref:DUF2786 domain-containing protein n=1 Tax=Streptomyces poonensis TaxID=68255 RepID=A0A918PKW3_9ACTN|nr:hypothetical protein GCM10010365_37370 [Streptomyces poonensis]GLJ91285.1 hypothetical protein GCM10017589_38910 [Streptomyces poonensis]
MDSAFGTALYADTDAALDAGASLLAADPSADPEVARRGRDFVAAAWRRGWQPADVVRLVRRELDDHHVRLVARLILDEQEHPAPEEAGRGSRWAAQLGELDGFAPPPRTDRFSHATAVLELYRLLLRLPALEPLGEARAPRSSPGSPERPSGGARVLSRIRALLAKAEATGFPEEAEALSAKAQELMARHSIDEALLAARAHDPNVPSACRIGVDPPYETAKAVLLDAVARANRCQAVWNEALGFSTVVGFEPDLEAVELLYTSLLVQATTAMTTAEAAQRAGGRKRTKTFRQSFLAAYAYRIGDRLAAVAEAQTEASGSRAEGVSGETPGPDLLPVLAARDLAVHEQVTRLFPDTVTTRVRGVSDEAGWHQGAEAADRARLAARPRLP